MGDLSDATLPLSSARYVYPDPTISTEGSACEERTSSFLVGTYTRWDLYTAIKIRLPAMPTRHGSIT
jgi:hypothetical protein